ncbi:MAG: SDR family oxidoreductase [Gammaproteobacteria bacterium]|nr:SDR family oxidoreductase [Gammaproteobacteria bacterium]MBU1819402.1 SDR family oxidoreductase [Gammaproteobacteria bacterium]
MKIVVIGGNGLIGSRLVALLQQRGHEAISASPSTGVNTLTGEGLAATLVGAQVVVDVANSPSFEDMAVMHFFETSCRNLLAAEATAGVRHHVALSVVGTERLQASGYFRAKQVQEQLIEASEIPYTIVRATQFMEFLAAIAQSATEGQTVRLPPAHLQPVAAQDVALVMADAALGAPVNGMVEIGGPERASMAAIVERYLRANGDARIVVADAQAPYFGVSIDDGSLTTRAEARLGAITLDAWLAAR